MNYNPNAAAGGVRNRKLDSYYGTREGGTRTQASGPRKMLRVGDTKLMGAAGVPPPAPNPYMNAPTTQPMLDPMLNMSGGNAGGFNMNNSGGSNAMYPQMDGFSGGGGGAANAMPMSMPTPQQPNMAYGQQMPMSAQAPQQSYASGNTATAPQVGGYNNAPMAGGMPPGQIPPQFAMFQQPIVQDMAMQYGQRLADQGKQMVESQFQKYVPVGKLKYYFAVDNKYVVNKLRLLFFPFLHKDWSLKYDQENPVQPRYDINAPDLYIPAMAYITYVVVAGLMLIMQNRFTPEQLGIQASSALAFCIFELVVYLITLYVVNIKTNLKTLDLLAFAGYKFVAIVACLLVSTIFHKFGYYLTWTYASFALGLFLLRTLKTKVLNEATTTTAGEGPINYDPYGNPQQLDYTGGRKRKLYFLFLIVGGQAFLSWLLSKHLYLPDPSTNAAAVVPPVAKL